MNIKKHRHLTQVFLLVKVTFSDDGAQLHLIFQALYCTLKRLDNIEKVVSWKPKYLSAEKFTTVTTIDNNLSPSVNWYGDPIFCLSFKGRCINEKMPFLLLQIEKIIDK